MINCFVDMHCSDVCVLCSAAYYLPRHLAPAPGYPHPYSPYLIQRFSDTAALENRHTLFTDYITSQQMHQWPAAMAQRPDLLRGLTPRDQPLTLPYSPAPRGTCTHTHCGRLVRLGFDLIRQGPHKTLNVTFYTLQYKLQILISHLNSAYSCLGKL